MNSCLRKIKVNKSQEFLSLTDEARIVNVQQINTAIAKVSRVLSNIFDGRPRQLDSSGIRKFIGEVNGVLVKITIEPHYK
jgi:hypothetical protein